MRRFIPMAALPLLLAAAVVGCTGLSSPDDAPTLDPTEAGRLHNELLRLAHFHDHASGHTMTPGEAFAAAGATLAAQEGRPDLRIDAARADSLYEAQRTWVDDLVQAFAGGRDGAAETVLMDLGLDVGQAEQLVTISTSGTGVEVPDPDPLVAAMTSASEEFWIAHGYLDGTAPTLDLSKEEGAVIAADAAGLAVGLRWVGMPIATIISTMSSNLAAEALDDEEEGNDPALDCCRCTIHCTGGGDGDG